MLVASMNPSPSGYFYDPDAPISSSPAEIQRYLGKISGPLLDRIDIHIEVTPVPFEKLSDGRKGEGSAEIRKRVIAAREIQTQRFQGDHAGALQCTDGQKADPGLLPSGYLFHGLVKTGYGSTKTFRQGL